VTERCEDLDLFFDRELLPQAEQAYRDHLAGCARCQEVLLGRMLEATVVGEDRNSRPSFDPIPTLGPGDAQAAPEPAPEPPQGPAEPPAPPRHPTRFDRRRVLLVAAAVLPAAAVAALLLWPATPPPPGAVAIRLAPERFVDVRFTAAELDHYRKPLVMRAAGDARTAQTEQIGLAVLAGLEQRGDGPALVAAYALNGELEMATHVARPLPRTAARLSDRAALELLRAERTADASAMASYQRALALAAEALRLDPGTPQAQWNQAIALRQLGLSLSAARAFEAVAARTQDGWSGEAADQARRLRARDRADAAAWQQITAAADRMAVGGPVMSADDVPRAASLVRNRFYVALATAATADRIASLAPLAAALDARFATTALGELIARVRGSDLRARAPLAAELRTLVELRKPRAAVAALRAQAARGGAPDIALATFLVIDERTTEPADLVELDRLAAHDGDPWWRMVELARRAFLAEFRDRDYPAVDAIARAAAPACRTMDSVWCRRIALFAGGSNGEMGREDLAIQQLTAALQSARRDAARGEEIDAIDALGQAISNRVTADLDSSLIARAYLDEAAQRMATCESRLQSLDFAANTALQHHRLDDAARAREQADRLEDGECSSVGFRLNGETARLQLVLNQRASLATLRAHLAQLAGKPSRKLYLEYLGAAATLVDDRARGEQALRDAIAAATATPTASYAPLVRANAFDALVESVAASRDARAVLALLGERLTAPRFDRCVLGVASWNRLIVAALDAGGDPALEVREIPGGDVMLPPAQVVSPGIRARLAGCRRVEVLAPAPYFGAPGLLDDRVAWAYHAGPARSPRVPAERRELVVSEVAPPEDLHLPMLQPFTGGAGAQVLSGASATPTGVLAAMHDATLAVIVAHGVTDANEPTAASLILSPDPHGGYLLTASKVRAATLTGAPVVILAGCDAGRVQLSAEPWSLATSFLEAGARVVIAPTDPIPDAGAGEVFRSLVDRIRGGAEPLDALIAERTARGGAASWLSNIVVFE
jgi:hypothetical protein